MDLLQQGDDRQAAQAFEEVERQHPYSEWATRAQLMSAYAFYEANDYDEAVAAAQRFIDLHPGNKDVAYAYYLIGVSHYEQISDVGRDQKMTELALEAFDELIRRFPDSDTPAMPRSRPISPATTSPARRWRSGATTCAAASMSRRSTASTT